MNDPTETQSDSNTTLSSMPNSWSFKPLDLEAIQTLGAKTRTSIAWDLAQAGDTERLRALQGAIPFSIAPRWGNDPPALDASLCARILHLAEEDWFDGLILCFEDLFEQGKRRIDNSGSSEHMDFGPLATSFALDALAEKIKNPNLPLSPQARLGLAKAVRLAQSPCLPALTSLTLASHKRFYGFLRLDEAKVAACKSELDLLGISNTDPTLAGAAMALALHGEVDLLDSIVASPSWKAQLAAAVLFGKDAYALRTSDFRALHKPVFWKRAPDMGQHLLAHVRLAPQPEASDLSKELFAAIVQSAERDPAHPMLRMAAGIRPKTLFSSLCDAESSKTAKIASAAIILASADDLYVDACQNLLTGLFRKADPIMGSNAISRRDCLLDGLFSPLSGAPQMVFEAWSHSRPDEPDAYLALAAMSSDERLIEAICHCNSKERAKLGLDAMGLERAQHFPGRRKGLDSSLSMWIAHKAPSHVFEAMLDWFESKGALREQAEAKAWVYQSHDTRKKGDLLADCVARGDLAQARLVLSKLPSADTRPAKDVAKAMVKKAPGDQGGAALGAWESLLLNKTLDALQSKELKQGNLPSEPTPKRSQRL